MGPAVGKGFVASFSISYQGEGVGVVKVSSSGSGSRNFRVFMIKVTDISPGLVRRLVIKLLKEITIRPPDNATNLLNLHV